MVRCLVKAVWPGIFFAAALVATPVLAQNSKTPLSQNSAERATTPLDSNAGQLSGSTNDVGQTKDNDTLPQKNNGNDRNDNYGRDLNSPDRFEFPDPKTPDDAQSANANTPATLAEQVLSNMRQTILTIMQQWEYGPNELVPEFMATDQEVNDALQKVLNRPDHHAARH